jgi:hypothetical protein
MNILGDLLEAERLPILDELEGKNIDVLFRMIRGRLGDYFSSLRLQGKILKVDRAKKRFVLEYLTMSLNDETVKGGPGGDIRPYKTDFSIGDIDRIDDRHGNYVIEMKG